MAQACSIQPSSSQGVHDTHVSALSQMQHTNKKHLSTGKAFHFSISSGYDSREYLEKEKKHSSNMKGLKIKSLNFWSNNFDTSTFCISKQHKQNVLNKQILSKIQS